MVLDVIEKIIFESEKLGADFVDIRIEKKRSLSISLREGVPVVSSGTDYGAAIRVFIKGSMGFAYTAWIDTSNLRQALERAYAMARAGAGYGGNPSPVQLKALRDSHVWQQKKPVEDVSIDVKMKDIMELDKLVSAESSVKSRTVMYVETIEYKAYGSTEQRFIEEQRSLIRVAVNVFGVHEGIRASAYASQGTTKGYVVWEKTSPEELASKVLNRLRNQFKAKTPKAGVFPVVLGPETVGVFVHEAFGHLAEADHIVAGSVLKDKKGAKVASELVTIVDDPTVDDGFGTYKYDDEGVKAAKVVIVENGIHKQVMTDRVHASLLDAEPTGNARAESYRVTPLVRMRNTVLQPGNMKVEEVFEGIKYGYYIVAAMGGQTNLDGSFQVGVQEAYEIVNGEIGSPVRNMSISGNTIETLLNIDAVADDAKIYYGTCGKGQLVPVSLGGPHVRVRKITVGGRE